MHGSGDFSSHFPWPYPSRQRIRGHQQDPIGVFQGRLLYSIVKAQDWVPPPQKKTLLRVVPTVTNYVVIVSDISSGSISGISVLTFYSGILSGIYFDILSGILSGIYSDIFPGILSGILSDILSGIYSDILSGIYSGILSDILFWHPFWHLF